MISIHVPIAGNDVEQIDDLLVHIIFQSTFPLQGTTFEYLPYSGAESISIHVPIAGNDLDYNSDASVQ